MLGRLCSKQPCEFALSLVLRNTANPCAKRIAPLEPSDCSTSRVLAAYATSTAAIPGRKASEVSSKTENAATQGDLSSRKAAQKNAALRAEAAQAMTSGRLMRTRWMSLQQDPQTSKLRGILPEELEGVIQYALANPQEMYPGQGPPLIQEEDGQEQNDAV
ncbi:hypothetical protein WJX74_009962 [Apatococcus lobatus]|uniref:Uncharacterized protein n=1 Tax=Apatococcus lobatus TaxID=904363 RepID=A0AAW1RAH3_9CHLO